MQVNRERMVQEFIELVSIDSKTLEERLLADALKCKLLALGLEVMEDDAAKAIGGDTGNIIARLTGTKQSVPVVVFAAHLDRVTPGTGIKPRIRDNTIYSDGTTILAADDVAAIVQMLEAVRLLKEYNIAHGEIELLFTVCEEAGMKGAKHLDRNLLKAEVGFFLDGVGDVGKVINQAPSQARIAAKVLGKAAHAGLEPEKGISAIQVTADAISHMTLGRIDAETTCNIGTINGGVATNIVAEQVDVNTEVRSRDEAKLHAQVEHIVGEFQKAAERWSAKVEIDVTQNYPAMNVTGDSPAVKWAMQAVESIGRTPRLEATGGGSDANILNGKGLPSIVLSVGMEKAHSKEEFIKIEELVKGAELVVAVIQQVAMA